MNASSTDLTSLLPHLCATECLNQHPQHTFESMLQGSSSAGLDAILRSDCDEQLIMNLMFKGPVKIHFVTMLAPHDSPNRPNAVRVFLNEKHVVFANVETLKPVEITEALQWRQHPKNPALDVATLELKSGKYTNAFQCTIFIESNASDGEEDVTELCGLDLVGKEGGGMGTCELPKKG